MAESVPAGGEYHAKPDLIGDESSKVPNHTADPKCTSCDLFFLPSVKGCALEVFMTSVDASAYHTSVDVSCDVNTEEATCDVNIDEVT